MESSVLLLTQPHPWRPKYSFHSLFQNPLPSSQPSRSYTPKYRRWDSNAETIRSQRFGFNLRDKGNKEEEEDADGDEEEEEDYNYNGSKEKKKRRWWSDDYSESEMEEGSGGILDEAIDSVWILKVFRSYGWAFPAIIVSLLLSTGAKAFLMALAFPLCQSAFSLAFEKLWGGTQSRPKRKSKTRRRRKPFASTVDNVKMDEEQETSNKKMDYQSWVVGNDVSVDNSGQNASGLGGWDDLERTESARRQSRRKPMGKGKLSKRERKSDTPLLFRLLIAVFPFLGSWTKMFW
ncbi:hypothetical protein PRUPE_1G052600 [Prunus persica]|uniref:Uncharacterized protein n=1 Tax=Prunus persica TaxID=3760 RepID=M5XV82_PRUPE|nr:uncharacterized protein LOC18788847 [Prunus persica]ONI26882.1 hypothetical protein PRUPE_1G052600 [Prunus persica]